MSLEWGTGGGSDVTDNVNHGSDASLDDLSAWTMLLWLYPTSTPPNVTIFSQDSTGPFSGPRISIPTSEMFIRVKLKRSGGDMEYITNSQALVTNKWQCLAITFDQGAAAGELANVYVGDLATALAESTYGTTNDSSGTWRTYASNSLRIGNSGETPGTGFPGRIALVAFHNRVLSLEEVRAQQFQTQRPADPDACVIFTHYGHWWGTGTQIDLSGKGNHGTNNGAVLAEHAPIRVKRLVLAPYTALITTPVSRQIGCAYEALELADMDDPASWELLGRAPETAVAPQEWLGPAVVTRVGPIEWLLGHTAAGPVNWESLLGVSASAAPRWEALLGLAGSAAVPWEAGSAAGVSQTKIVPIEWLLGLIGSNAMPWEAQGNTPVSQTRVVPIEWLGRLAPARLVGLEWVSPLTVTDAAAWESLFGARTTRQAALELLAGLAPTRAAPFEWLSGLAPARVAAWESLAGLSPARTAALEWLNQAAAALGVPLEWFLGVAVGTTVPWEADGPGPQVSAANSFRASASGNSFRAAKTGRSFP